MSRAAESYLTHEHAVKRIAIIGGGQLAKMLTMAGARLGCEFAVLEREASTPATALAQRSLLGGWDDVERLLELAGGADVVTLENEFVDADSLNKLERRGYTLAPGAKSIALVQDKYIQKKTLEQAGLPLPAFRAVETRADIAVAGKELGWPLVVKKRRNGYDGKGNASVNGEHEIDSAWRRLDGDHHALYAEAFCPFSAELAVIITTGYDGATAVYPLVETVQRAHICHIVRAPAAVPDNVAKQAVALARRATQAVHAVGSFGVEMFLLKNGDVFINELAPRVHNSGHYSIEACECSQFENHLRAIAGWPLGSTKMIAPAAVMVNLLGSGDGSGQPAGLDEALAVPGAQIHIYGKERSTPGRKMGHVTALGDSLAEAEQNAQNAAKALIFGDGA